MKIKNKMMLRDRLNHGNYDVIAIWNDGRWAEVGTGYGGEQDGHNPMVKVKRAWSGELTHAGITELIRSIEMGYVAVDQ